ncbi:MAG: putative sugar O-methyltransferase [Campylobacteraceae bacterium]|jgi:putative sugar O-methyltransferase|nr:putative sugar O-methyltransferase [Campylobacteraceae bacterium]
MNFINRMLNKLDYKKIKFGTSLSDDQLYPDFCIKASIDAHVFSNFRQNRIYCRILEHCNETIGLLYLDEIIKNRQDLLDNIEQFKENDKYGNPYLVDYVRIGKISPSTLRYIKVLSDLLNLFYSLDGLRICEIGVGYGGQCRIINSIASPLEYVLVDLKPVLMLAQSYLDNYILKSSMRYKTMNELKEEKYDLVISNYAFTELRREVQDCYLKKIILNSRCGYITYNDITPKYFKSYKKDELLSIIPNSHIINEVPLTHSNNCIIVWGDS